MKIKLILLIILPPLLASIFISIHVGILLLKPYTGKEIEFIINPGEGFSKINARLNQKQLISNPRVFHYYAKFTDNMNKLKAGSYIIKSGDNIPAIIDRFVNGVPLLSSVTIAEGKNIFEIGKILEKAEIINYEDFIKVAKDTSYVKELGLAGLNFEGYLFPDTYHFAKGSSAKTIISTMVAQFKKATSEIDFSQSQLSLHEIITLASIVEKETGAKFERATIAGVFHNRLKKSMRLQSDPTTIYGIYESFDGNLRKKHLQEKTDYNTYKVNGLPIGPISNPGLEAIKATIKPEQHQYLYFVSRNDGTHVFTPTYKEHLKAVKYWQKTKENREGRSWRDLQQ